jgi:hypothetical protein
MVLRAERNEFHGLNHGFKAEEATFNSSTSLIILTRLSGPCSRPTIAQKSGSAGNRILDVWICSQEV